MLSRKMGVLGRTSGSNLINNPPANKQRKKGEENIQYCTGQCQCRKVQITGNIKEDEIKECLSKVWHSDPLLPKVRNVTRASTLLGRVSKRVSKSKDLGVGKELSVSEVRITRKGNLAICLGHNFDGHILRQAEVVGLPCHISEWLGPCNGACTGPKKAIISQEGSELVAAKPTATADDLPEDWGRFLFGSDVFELYSRESLLKFPEE